MPVDIEVAFVRCLSDDVEYRTKEVQGDSWMALRKHHAQLWLHAWQRLGSSIDPSVDINEVLPLHPPLPPGVDLPEGVAPEAIKDPALRKQYEDAIRDHNQRAERIITQRRVRKLYDSFSKDAERYLIVAYSSPPSNIEELRQLLTMYGIDKDISDRIVDTVAKNMGIG